MRMLICLVALTWIVSTLVYQFYTPLRNAVARNSLTLFGFLPNWQLFAPSAIQGQYELQVREFNDPVNILDHWRDLPYIKPKNALTPLINANLNQIKAITAICYAANNNTYQFNPYYLLLLNMANASAKRRAAGSKFVQFKVLWRADENLREIFTSAIHEIS